MEPISPAEAWKLANEHWDYNLNVNVEEFNKAIRSFVEDRRYLFEEEFLFPIHNMGPTQQKNFQDSLINKGYTIKESQIYSIVVSADFIQLGGETFQGPLPDFEEESTSEEESDITSTDSTEAD